MINPYEGKVIGAGTRIQAGVPLREQYPERRANGLLLRGVVTATYVSDNTDHPVASYADDSRSAPIAVYCDVLVYPSIPGQRWFVLTAVLVTQPTGGMHRGRIWKPRATSIDIAKKTYDGTSNPAHLDGDHVLVGFMNDNLDQPVILRGLPHPAMDTGEDPDGQALGKRMKLKAVDGDPDFVKHHGTYYGVADNGNFVVDSTWANNGILKNGDGHEADPPTDGKGSQEFKLPQDATFDIVFYDMSNPASPVEVIRLKVDNGSVKLDDGTSLVKAAIADHMATLWGQLKSALDTWGGAAGHVHSSPAGGSTGPPSPVVTTPAWNSDIESQKLTFPDN